MKRRIERLPLPDPTTLRRLVCERPEDVAEGAALVDPDAQGSTGVDVLLVDEAGRPIFVDIVADGAGDVPSRVFDHLDWMERNRRLFLRAYSRDGVVKAEDPVLVFVGGGFPTGVVRAVSSMNGAPVRLIRAEHFLIDGKDELLLEEVTSRAPSRGRAVTPRGTDTGGTGPDSSPEEKIESESVRTLLALFKSGVDGLDARIAESESDGGIAFELEGAPLAKVAVSPGSFTVSLGDRLANPIVVSDRVSLERALNAVVSLFVRDGRPGPGGRAAGQGPEMSDAERAELASIWGSGIAQGDNG